MFDPDPSLRWLFCFTHPDDEISIVAWMKRLTDCGASVYAGWSVTNPVRQDEATAAIEGIGVPKTNIFFHAMPDKGACDNIEILTEVWRKTIEAVEPNRIALGAFECGHIDHDTTNFCVHRAKMQLGSDAKTFEIPFYHTYLTRVPKINCFADPIGEEIIKLTDQERLLKMKMSRGYPSQNIGSLLYWYTVLGWAKFNPARLCQAERMREQTHFDFQKPNLPDRLASKVIISKTWHRWLNAIEPFIDR